MENLEEVENPVAYWQRRSRQALESQGVVLPPLRRLRASPIKRQPSEVPPEVVNLRRRTERIGLDLTCDSCFHHISKSRRLGMVCYFYAPDGPRGSPLTRCYARCTSCSDEFVLGRNIGDADNFVVIAGATQRVRVHAPDVAPSPNIEDEGYPDAVLDSPNDMVLTAANDLVLPAYDSDFESACDSDIELFSDLEILDPVDYFGDWS